jgi:diacylglycerol kinase (ATP)
MSNTVYSFTLLLPAKTFSESLYHMTQKPFGGATGLRRIWNAMFYSFAGLRAALRYESAFRQESMLAIVLIPAACFLPATGIGKALMVGSVILVLIVELLNSAVETAIDRISLDDHILAKRAKDLGSAAVFLSLLNVPIVWLLVMFA